jgi:hypothetical protein
MPDYLEVNGQDIERYTYLVTDDGEPRCSIDIQGEAIWSGKTKALIVIMPHYDNDIPQVINVGLDNTGIEYAINIADGAYRDIDTYKKETIRLQQEVDRLEIQLDAAREGSIYGNSF